MELLPRPWTHPQPIVNITPWAVDDRHVPFAAQLVTDVPSGMELIGKLLPPARWDLEAVHRTLVAQRQRLCPEAAGLSAHRVVQVAADAAATRARVTVDAGAHMFPATMLWPVSEPNGMLISNGLSTMGFALPAAIGAALVEREGAPGAIHDHDGPVVALTGDGGLLMCAGELLTAVRERLRVVTIVFSDASLSLIDIKQQQRKFASSGRCARDGGLVPAGGEPRRGGASRAQRNRTGAGAGACARPSRPESDRSEDQPGHVCRDAACGARVIVIQISDFRFRSIAYFDAIADCRLPIAEFL